MFASVTKRELKFGEGFITIRKLSGYQLDLAREEASARQIGHLRKLGGELITAMNSSEVNRAAAHLQEKQKDETETAKQRYVGYDRMTVLTQGIVAWSAGDVTPEKIRDLEEDVAQETFEAIVDLTVPPKVRAEQQEEKDS